MSHTRNVLGRAVTLVNLTGAELTLLGWSAVGETEHIVTLPSAGKAAVQWDTSSRAHVEGQGFVVPIFAVEREFVGLPDRVFDTNETARLDALLAGQHRPVTTLFIVDDAVRLRCPYRYDLASPGEVVRDDAGNLLGHRGLWMD